MKKENIDDGVAITITRVSNSWASDKKFFKNRFNPDKIRVTVVREPAKVFELFRKGELDWHGMSLPGPLSGLTKLEVVYLSNNQISDISPLLQLKSLKQATLKGNKASAADIEKLKKALPKGYYMEHD